MRLTLFFINILSTQSVFSIPLPHGNEFFPLSARNIADISTGSLSFIGDADVLLPIYGSKKKILFADATGAAGTGGSWMGSGGLGIRQALSNNILLGAYAFGDRDNDGYGGRFWVLNPGVEIMTAHFDAHINGYFPLNRNNKLMNLGLANNVGIDQLITFQGHTEYDQTVGLYRVIGNGIDAEVGLSTPYNENRARLFVGFYYYSLNQGLPLPATNPVSRFFGPQFGVEAPTSAHLSFMLAGSYNQVQKNQVRFTARYKFGEIIQKRGQEVEQRILDPIVRHEGTLGTASGIVSQQRVFSTGNTQMVRNNVWFFSPNGTSTFSGLNSCTADNPCYDFDSATISGIAAIAPSADYYFAPGTYNATDSGAEIILLHGESLFGRSNNFKMPSLNNSFTGGFELSGTNKSYLIDHLNIQNNNAQDSTPNRTALTVDASNQLTVNNSILGANGDAYSSDIAGIYNSGTATINNTSINVNGSNIGNMLPHQTVTGIYSLLGEVAVNSSQITVNSLNQMGNSQISGISNDNSTITVTHSSIEVTSSNANAAGSIIGFYTMQGQSNLINSTLSIAGVNEHSTVGFALVDGTALIQNSSINSTINGAFGDVQAGVYVGGGALTMNNSQINFSGSNSSNLIGIEGIDNSSSVSITLNNSTVNINGGDNVMSLAGVFAAVNTGSAEININSSHFNIAGTASGGGLEAGAGAMNSGAVVNFADNSSIYLSNSTSYGVIVNGGILTNDGTTICNGSVLNCNFGG